VVLGTAFSLGVGERSSVIKGEGGYFIIESLGRKLADSTTWLAQRDTQREQLRQAVQQARMQQYMEAVRAKARIVDRRKELFRAQVAAEDLTF
jgi:parvulin-like peptidyl-prolyl isomerase